MGFEQIIIFLKTIFRNVVLTTISIPPDRQTCASRSNSLFLSVSRYQSAYEPTCFLRIQTVCATTLTMHPLVFYPSLINDASHCFFSDRCLYFKSFYTNWLSWYWRIFCQNRCLRVSLFFHFWWSVWHLSGGIKDMS